MSYGLSQEFERTIALLCVRSKVFWLRIGNRIDQEGLGDPTNQLLVKLAKSVAVDHGWPDESLVIQRAALWMNEGSVSSDDLDALADVLGDRIDVDVDRTVNELIAPVRLSWSQQLTREVMDRYKNGGFFGPTLLAKLAACDELGSPVAEVETKSSEFGEDTEQEVKDAPTGRKLLTGIYELDTLWKGGWPLGTLMTLLMDSKAGKSMFACYMSACALLQGENVGYLSLELPKSEIHKRVLAAIVGCEINDLEDPRMMADALRAWRAMKSQRQMGRMFIDKFEAGTMDTDGVAAWFRHQEKVHDARIRFRVVDYGDIVKSPLREDRDSAYNTGKTVWQALANMAQDKENPNWVLTPTQSKRPDWKVGQPIPLLTRSGLADSIHKVRITDFLVSETPQPDIRASAGYTCYVDADRFLGTTGTPLGPIPHFMKSGRMADMSHVLNHIIPQNGK